MLDTERKYFEDHQAELATQFPGKFVIIKDESVIGAFTTAEDALAEATKQLGTVPFLLRRTDERPSEVTIPALTLGILRANTHLSA